MPAVDALFVGNAIMDVFGSCDDTFLTTHEIEKGSMTLVDEARALTLYNAMSGAQEQSGGSAANSAFGFAMLGGSAAFSGKLADDEVGNSFVANLRSGNVQFTGTIAADGPASARSMIFVTPDAQRSMNTYLGASLTMTDASIQDDITAKFIYLEGYLFDAPDGPAIFAKAAQLALETRAALSLTLSDSWCVERHKDALSTFIRDHVSILFSNQDEIQALLGTDDDDTIASFAREIDELIVTKGATGADIWRRGEKTSVSASLQGPVIDTTGAGDLFAAGYLYGRSAGETPHRSGQIASLCAGEIISHYGARPETNLADLIAILS